MTSLMRDWAAKAHGQAEDADAGQERAGLDAHELQDEEGAHQHHHQLDRRLRQRREGLELPPGLAAAHPVEDPRAQQRQHRGVAQPYQGQPRHHHQRDQRRPGEHRPARRGAQELHHRDAPYLQQHGRGHDPQRQVHQRAQDAGVLVHGPAGLLLRPAAPGRDSLPHRADRALEVEGEEQHRQQQEPGAHDPLPDELRRVLITRQVQDDDPGQHGDGQQVDQGPHRPQEPFLRTAVPKRRLHDRAAPAQTDGCQRQHHHGKGDHQEAAQRQARGHVVAGRVQHHVTRHQQHHRGHAHRRHRRPKRPARLRGQPPAPLAVTVGAEDLVAEEPGPEDQRHELQRPGQHRTQRVVPRHAELRQRQGEQDEVGRPHRGAAGEQQRHAMRRGRLPARPLGRQPLPEEAPGSHREPRQQAENQHGRGPRPRRRREADLSELPFQVEQLVEAAQQRSGAVRGLPEKRPVGREQAHRLPVPQPQHPAQDEGVEALELIFPLAFQFRQARRALRQLVEDALLRLQRLLAVLDQVAEPGAHSRRRPPFRGERPRVAPGVGIRAEQQRAQLEQRLAVLSKPPAQRLFVRGPGRSSGPGAGTSRAQP